MRMPFTQPILEARKEQIIGESYFKMKNFQHAQIHFKQSLNFITNQASIDRIDDWLERCEWFEKNAERYLK